MPDKQEDIFPDSSTAHFVVLNKGHILQCIAQLQEWDDWFRGQVHTEFHKETDDFPEWLYQFVVPFANN